MGPITTIAAGIEIDVTGGRALEAVDRAMDGAGCTRLRDIEADMVLMAVHAFEAPQIGSRLEAGESAVEVRSRPLREVLARLLAEYTAPSVDFRVAMHQQLIALTFVEGAECDQADRARH